MTKHIDLKTEMTESSIETMEEQRRVSRRSKNLENTQNEQTTRDPFDLTYSRFPNRFFIFKIGMAFLSLITCEFYILAPSVAALTSFLDYDSIVAQN